MKRALAIWMLLGLLFHATTTALCAQSPAPLQVAGKYLPAAMGNVPLFFEKNVGQLAPDVHFLSRGAGYNLLLKSDEAVMTLQPSPVRIGPPAQTSVLRMKLAGANPRPHISGEQTLPTKVNYLLGRDQTDNFTHVETCAQVLARGVYPGIDLVYYGNQQTLEYDFRVAPGADPKRIAMRFGGAQKIDINQRGELVLQVGSATVVQHAPVIYQQKGARRIKVAGRYVVRSKTRHEIGFALGAYDKKRALVIDPQLVYSTFLPFPSQFGEERNGIAADGEGFAYIAGTLPTTALAGFSPQVVGPAPGEAVSYVAKINPDGSSLAYLTIFALDLFPGTNYTNYSAEVRVDSRGHAYTNSSQGFVKLSRNGASVLATIPSTIGAQDFAVDNAGRVFITGNADQGLVIKNGFISASGEDGGPAVQVFDSNQSGEAALLYSSYLPAGIDVLYLELATDGKGHVAIGGNSDGRARTKNAFQEVVEDELSSNFSQPYFLCLDIAQVGESSLLYATYLGGNPGFDRFRDIAMDRNGGVYLTGAASYFRPDESNFPVRSAAQGFQSMVNQYAFAAKFNPFSAGDASLVYSTLLAGNITRGIVYPGNEPVTAQESFAIAVNRAGEAFVTGFTDASDFPQVDSIQGPVGSGNTDPNNFVLGYDAFVTKLSADGTTILFSTYLGGTLDDSGQALALDGFGTIYVRGHTLSPDFPVRSPFPGTGPSGNSDPNTPDTFLAKIGVLVRSGVNSTGDASNVDPNQGLCDTGATLPDGQPECTLRAAIEKANASAEPINPADPETIRFFLSGAAIPTIRITKPLPAITRPLLIDGTSQPGSKMVEISGDGAGASTAGLTIIAGDSTLRGLVINGFGGDGVLLRDKPGNTIEGCFIGSNAAGTAAHGNAVSGIHILNSANNVIGGVKVEQANVISGNGSNARGQGGVGVLIEGSSSTNNKLQGNYIGTNKNGNGAVANALGVYILGAPNNVIGGADPRVLGTRNIISGNGTRTAGCGILIDGATALNNKIQGNFIGTDKSGTRSLPNFIGLCVGPLAANFTGPPLGLNTLIGGLSSKPGAAPGNVIAGNFSTGLALSFSKGNTVQGNVVGTNVGGTATLGNGSRSTTRGNFSGTGIYIFRCPENTIGGASAQARNVISGNVNGVLMIGPETSKNTIASNYIGTDASGSRALANQNGVVLGLGANNNLIGGPSLGTGNVIAGNRTGVLITLDPSDPQGKSGPETLRNTVQNNLIGTDRTASRAVANVIGVELGFVGQNAISNNIIGGNSSVGVAILRASSQISVQGNRIGVAYNGTTALPNGYGVLVLQSHDNLIGGATAGARNIISGNKIAGVAIGQVLASPFPPGVVLLTNDGGFSTDNKVLGNFIGTNVSGSGALGNGGSASRTIGAGVLISSGASGTKIGDTSAASGNVIAGNVGSGVALIGASASNLVKGVSITNNLIGVAPNGRNALPNAVSGVRLTLASGNTIGGNNSANIIAFNGFDGVTVVSGRGNSVLSNAIYSNRKLGINLVGGPENTFGATLNDDNDVDSGANDLQNFPEITGITQVGSATEVTATLQSKASSRYLIQFFSNVGRTPAGYGQGQKYLGSTEVNTNASGLAAIKARLPAVLGIGQTISMTATNAEAGTSEFSALPFAIRGQITHLVSDPSNPDRTIKQGIAGVVVGRVKRVGNTTQIADTATTDAQGFYSFNAAPPGTYLIVPAKEGPDFQFVFDPTARAVTLPATGSGAPDAIGVDFVTYTIGGLVKDATGKPLSGITVALGGAAQRTLVTNSAGRYLFDGLGRGSYSVTAGSGFTPPSQIVALPASGSVTVNFTRPTPAAQIATRTMDTISTISASGDSIRLVFTRALDEDASDASNYTVLVNDQSVEIDSISVNGSRVTLTLADKSLRSGDVVSVQWSGLRDNSGQVLAGRSPSLKVP